MHFFHLHLPGYYTTTAKNDDDGRPLPQKSLNIKKEKGAGIRVSSFPALFSVAIMPARVLIKFSFSKSHQAAISSRKIVRKRNRPRRTSLLPNNTQTTTKKKLDIEREETGTNQSDRSHPIKQKEWSEEKNFAVLFFLSLFFLLCICVCLLPSIAPTETKRPRGRWTPAAVPIYWARRNTRPEQVRKGSPHQMGRGEWQNGSLASHARRRQRR